MQLDLAQALAGQLDFYQFVVLRLAEESYRVLCKVDCKDLQGVRSVHENFASCLFEQQCELEGPSEFSGVVAKCELLRDSQLVVQRPHMLREPEIRHL